MPTPYRILSDDTLNLLAERGNAQALMELAYRAERLRIRLGILAEAQELARRLREGSKEMSDCKHCDHLAAFWKDAAGEHERWQCCHCGRIRERGPFLPQSRFAESKTESPMNCGRCPLDARNPDHDCAAPDCLDDQDMPAFLRSQAE